MLPIMWVIYIRNFTDQTLEVPYMELIQAVRFPAIEHSEHEQALTPLLLLRA